MEASAKEKVFLDDNGVFISNTRLNFSGTTYATANITSVSTFYVKPSRKWEIILFIIGLICFSMDVTGIILGVVLIGISILMFKFKKTKHCVRLSSSASEKDALWSTDKNFIGNVVSAINEAIIYRG